MLALAPECGCTLACSAPNSAQRAVAGELLGLVDHVVAAVVALARVALGVLVGEDRALRREHRRRREVLRRDELDRGVLALDLAPDDLGDLGIGGGERVGNGPRVWNLSAVATTGRDYRPPRFSPRCPATTCWAPARAGRSRSCSTRGLRDPFAAFFARGDTFALGVCNGCQMMSNLHEIIPGTAHWPHFVRNASEQFEARFVMLEVLPSPSLFFDGMAGQPHSGCDWRTAKATPNSAMPRS